MNYKFFCFVLATGFLAVRVLAADESAGSASARVDKLFAEWKSTNSPGIGVAVSQKGAVVYERGYGMANLELGVPITTASVFPAASISKQFTAMSVLLLVQRGKLSLDDEVKKFFPDWAYTERPITIRHLLTHTSGLREGFTLIGISEPQEGVNVNDAIAVVLARQRGLNFAPGSEFQYNNSGYNLLGTMVKRVSGQTLRQFAEENIFKPLGMTHTHFHDDPAMLVPNRVTGYSRRGESGFQLARPEGGIVGNAGLFTTARDLLRWEENFVNARVGDRTLVAEMQKPLVATDWGDGSFYGFGLATGEYRGLRMIGHGGGDPGISSYVARFPDQGVAIALLGNLDNINLMALLRGVADIYLAKAFSASSATDSPTIPAKFSPSTEQLAADVGLYHDPEIDLVGKFFLRNGKLMASADTGEENFVELAPVGENRFVISGTSVAIEFVPGSNGRPREARVTGVGLKPRTSRQLMPLVLSSQELRAFAGEYISPEIETTCTIVARESDLLLKIPGRSETVLSPVFRDAFSGLGIIKFSRDAHGVVTAFTVHRADLRGLRFDRK